MIELVEVDVSVRERAILRNVSLRVPDASVVAVIGPNGAGKTTLLDVVSGMIKPSRGRATIVTTGRVYQGSPLPSTLTVAEVAMLTTGTRKAAMTLVETYGLSQHAFSFVAELSSGMRRILDLAISTVTKPKALVLDEPSTGLARSEVVYLAELIKRLRTNDGCAVLLVEHDAWLVEEVADEVVVLERGAIIARGTVDQIFSLGRAPSARKTN